MPEQNGVDSSLPLVFAAYAKPEGPHVALGATAVQSYDAALIALACTAILVQRAHPQRHASAVELVQHAAAWLRDNPALHEVVTPGGIVLPHGIVS